MSGFTCTTSPTTTLEPIPALVVANDVTAFTISANTVTNVERALHFSTCTQHVSVSPLHATSNPIERTVPADDPVKLALEASPAIRRRVFDASGFLDRTFLPFSRTFKAGLLVAASLLTGDGYADTISQPAVAEPVAIVVPEQPDAVEEDELVPLVVVTSATGTPLAVYPGVANLIQAGCSLSDHAFVVGGNMASADTTGQSRWELAVGRRAGLAQVQVIGGILTSCVVDSSVTNGESRLTTADYNRIGRCEVTTAGRAGRVSNTQVYSGNGFSTLDDYFADRQGIPVGVFVG